MTFLIYSQTGKASEESKEGGSYGGDRGLCRGGRGGGVWSFLR